MAQEMQPIDIHSAPALTTLVDQLKRTRRPQVIEENGQPVALLVPATKPVGRGSRRTFIDTSDLPPVPQRSVRELAGIAGTLAQPRSWNEIEDIVAEERAAAYRSKHS